MLWFFLLLNLLDSQCQYYHHISLKRVSISVLQKNIYMLDLSQQVYEGNIPAVLLFYKEYWNIS